MSAGFAPDLLAGEVAVVTGAARGNGAAIARGLAACGAAVVAADLDAGGAEATTAEIAAAGGRALAFALDVADAAACGALAAAVERAFGAASVLVNNAGIIRRVTAGDDGFLAALREQLGVNAEGIANMVAAFLPQLRATRGRIVNLGSIAGVVATPGAAGYVASKGAVHQLTRALAVDLAPHGIRVNAIAPGVIATPMTESTRGKPDSIAKFLAHTPLRRVGEPEELTGPVVFLASRLSSYVTGAVLPVDGGYLAS